MSWTKPLTPYLEVAVGVIVRTNSTHTGEMVAEQQRFRIHTHPHDDDDLCVRPKPVTTPHTQ